MVPTTLRMRPVACLQLVREDRGAAPALRAKPRRVGAMLVCTACNAMESRHHCRARRLVSKLFTPTPLRCIDDRECFTWGR